MDQLERDLRQALERKQPSPDFAARVIAAAQASKVTPIRPPVAAVRPQIRRAMAAAAALVVLAGGSVGYREYQGHVAKERVMLAMRITASKLNRIQARVREMQP